MCIPHYSDRGTGRRTLAVAVLVTALAACGGSGTQGNVPASAPPVSTDVPRLIPDTGNPQGDAGTISFDATANGDAAMNTVLLAAGGPGQTSDRLSIVQNGTNLRVVVSSDVEENNVGISIANWEPGQVHTITFTWGDGEERVYVDGQLQTTIDLHDFRLQPGTPLYIGSGTPGSTGTITDFHAFGRPLTPEEVAMLYPTAHPGPALRVLSTGLTPAESAGSICVELTGSAGLVAGTQNDLVWDPACLAITDGCESLRQDGKDVHTRLPYPGRLRTLVFSMTDTNPIEDGVLYCCPYQVVALGPGGCCTVKLEGVLGSDPAGTAIGMDGFAGQVCSR
jgi:hypothetical protein